MKISKPIGAMWPRYANAKKSFMWWREAKPSPFRDSYEVEWRLRQWSGVEWFNSSIRFKLDTPRDVVARSLRYAKLRMRQQLFRAWAKGMKLSPWIRIGHCSTRVIDGSNPDRVENRMAFIEKTPRVRKRNWTGNMLTDHHCWLYGSEGHAPEYGLYEPARRWCDAMLKDMGFILPEDAV